MLASRNPSARARATSWALATLVDDVFDDDQQFHEGGKPPLAPNVHKPRRSETSKLWRSSSARTQLIIWIRKTIVAAYPTVGIDRTVSVMLCVAIRMASRPRADRRRVDSGCSFLAARERRQ